jgi:hypothetical protein
MHELTTFLISLAMLALISLAAWTFVIAPVLTTFGMTLAL